MVRTAIVHNRHDLTLEWLRDLIAKTTTAETKILPFQVPKLDSGQAWQSPHGDVVSAVHVATDNPVCFRLPQKGEVDRFRESCQSLQKYCPDVWATLVASSDCVFVENGHDVRIHSRSKDMTVYSIPVLQVTKKEIQETIWRVGDALDALVLAEEGQLIWRSGESGWSEPSLKGGRIPIARKSSS
jgi:hypothetical protein